MTKTVFGWIFKGVLVSSLFSVFFWATEYSLAITGPAQPPSAGTGPSFLRLVPLTTAPTALSGLIYFDSASNKFKCNEDGLNFANCLSSSSVWTEDTGLSKVFLANLANKVGIGTASPASPLHIVSGSAYTPLIIDGAASSYIRISTLGVMRGLFGYGDISANVKGLVFLNSSGSNLNMIIMDGGNVGIGTGLVNAPNTKLNIFDSVSGPIINLQGPTTNYRGLKIADTTNVENWFVGANSNNNFVIRRNTVYNDIFVDLTTGNTGIGTSAPSSKLEVNGLVRITTGNSNYLSVGAYNTTTDNFGYISSAGQTNGTGLKFEVANGPALNTGFTALTILNNGNVGIGITGPGEKLHVLGRAIIDGANGDIYTTSPAPFSATGVLLKAEAATPYVVAKTGTLDTASAFAVYNSTDSELFRVRSDGNVGIGTTTPLTNLEVKAPDNFANSRIRIDAATAAASELQLTADDASGLGWAVRRSAATRDFQIVGPALPNTALAILISNNNVGIGTAAPQAKLDVNGSFSAPGMWVPISSVTLTTSSPSISFPSIPTTFNYKMLKLSFALAGTDTLERWVWIRFNGSLSGYGKIGQCDWTGASIGLNGQTEGVMAHIIRSQTPARWTTGEAVINNVANQYKQLTGWSSDHLPFVSACLGRFDTTWENATTRITSILIWPEVGSFTANSQVTLMGIY